jgi:hypothetical protein
VNTEHENNQFTITELEKKLSRQKKKVVELKHLIDADRAEIGQLKQKSTNLQAGRATDEAAIKKLNVDHEIQILD